jgi:hypothetical protein
MESLLDSDMISMRGTGEWGCRSKGDVEEKKGRREFMEGSVR